MFWMNYYDKSLDIKVTFLKSNVPCTLLVKNGINKCCKWVILKKDHGHYIYIGLIYLKSAIVRDKTLH